MTDRKKYGSTSSDDSTSGESYDLEKIVEEELGCDYDLLTKYNIWIKNEAKTEKKKIKHKKPKHVNNTYSGIEYKREEFETSLEDKALYVEKDGELKECNFYKENYDNYYPIYNNIDGKLYIDFTRLNSYYSSSKDKSEYSYDKTNMPLKFDNFDIEFLVNDRYKLEIQKTICGIYSSSYKKINDKINKNILELNDNTINKYKFYLKDNNDVFQRVIVSKGEDGVLMANAQPIMEVNNDEIQYSNVILTDDGDITQVKLQDCAIEGMKRCVKRLNNKKNILEKDKNYLDLLVQIHNNNYNVQEYKQEDYIEFKEREFYDEKACQSKTRYYFDIKDQNNIPKRYYFFNEKKKEELKNLMQSCDELIAKGKLGVDKKGNIVSSL